MARPYETIKHLTTHYREILGERGVSFLLLLRGNSAAGRVSRLAQAAVAERSDYHASCEREDWLQDSEALYSELLAKAYSLGALSKERCAYYREQLQQEGTAAGRLRMLCQLQAKNDRQGRVLLSTVENIHLLTSKDRHAELPEPTEEQRLTA